MLDIDRLVIVAVGLVGLIVLILLILLPAWCFHRLAAERMDQLEGIMQSWKGRISSLEAALRVVQEANAEARDALRAAERDTRAARSHALGRSIASEEKTVAPLAPRVQPRALDAAGSGFHPGDRATGFNEATPGPSSPPSRQAAILELTREAATSLRSVGAFAEFAGRYSNGTGYVLDPSGQSIALSPVQGSPDRADLWALETAGQAYVFPGFNLRRSVPLLTGDNGRPAEARLGWLFDLVRGDELQPLEPAVVSLENWTVQQKGRLVLPL